MGMKEIGKTCITLNSWFSCSNATYNTLINAAIMTQQPMEIVEHPILPSLSDVNRSVSIPDCRFRCNAVQKCVSISRDCGDAKHFVRLRSSSCCSIAESGSAPIPPMQAHGGRPAPRQQHPATARKRRQIPPPCLPPTLSIALCQFRMLPLPDVAH